MNIPLNSQSRDLLACIMNFIDDVEETNAKKDILPIFDVLERSLRNSTAGETDINKTRINLISTFKKSRILDQSSVDLLSQSAFGKALSHALTVASKTLMFDFLGAGVNFMSGQLQLVMNAANPSRTGYKDVGIYLSTLKDATLYEGKIVRDWSRTDGKLSKETQLLKILGIFPKGFSIQDKTYAMKKYSSIRENLLGARKVTEEISQIHAALIWMKTNPILMPDGKTYNLEDIYEVNKDGNIDIIEKFKDNKDIQKQYNPLNGTSLNKKTIAIAQFTGNLLGNYSKITQAELSRVVWGKPIVFMKNWLFDPLLIRRFGKYHFDKISGVYEEGYYRTLPRVLMEILSAKKEGTLPDYLKQLKTDKFVIKSISRAFIETGMIIMSMLAISMLGFDDDDPDKWKKVKAMGHGQQLLLLLAMRVNQEISSYTPIPHKYFGFSEIQATFVDPWRPVRQTFGKYGKFTSTLISTIGYILGADNEKNVFYQKDGGHSFDEKGDPKLLAVLLKLTGWNEDLANPIPKMKLINNPR